MAKKIYIILAVALILSGCGKTAPEQTRPYYAQPATEPEETYYEEVNSLDDVAVNIDDVSVDSRKAVDIRNVRVQDEKDVPDIDTKARKAEGSTKALEDNIVQEKEVISID